MSGAFEIHGLDLIIAILDYIWFFLNDVKKSA